MNKDRILQVADAIEKHSLRGLQFTMLDWGWPPDLVGVAKGDEEVISCGTTACIAGHAVTLALQAGDLDKSELFGTMRIIRQPAAEWLDLTEGQAAALFTPEGMSKVTSKMAVDALRRFASTGEIDFQIPEDAPEVPEPSWEGH